MKCIVRHCLLWSLAILLVITCFAVFYLFHQNQAERLSLRKRKGHSHWNKRSISVRTGRQSIPSVQRFLRNESESYRIQQWNEFVGHRKSPRPSKSANFPILYLNESISIRRFSDIMSTYGPKSQPNTTLRRLNLHKSISDRVNRHWMKTGKVPKWKRVLFYTTVFGKNPKEVWGENAPFEKCKVPGCVLIDQRSSLLQSDAVIFHGRDMPLRLPIERYPSQRWIYFNRENPQYTSPKAGKYNGVFNWTMTYKRTSDIWAPYGLYRRISPLTDGTESQKGKNIAAGKSRLIAWATSHCESTGFLRERYVEQLALKVPIDVFGQCKPNAPKCPRRSKDCEQRLKTYKFYLAFENAFCEDYITEKFWEQAVKHEMVPVVMGGADYKQLVPPKSYIDILDFASVDKLAQYLVALDRNSSAYNEYFEWRTRYKVTQGMRRGWCQLCRMLHDDSLPRKVYWDLGKFWSVKEDCLRHATAIFNQV